MLIDDTSYKFKIIYEMTQKENNLLTVSMLCEIAQVSRSGYYNWVNSEDMRIKKKIRIRKILKSYYKLISIEVIIKVQEAFI